ncbi:MAG TPA: dTMP kinase [Burkholderiales bacterium]|nr:dTMP kinase [Burkholderiales bacterium]
MKRGKFISLEGIDGAGKSSHVEWLAGLIRHAGHELIVTREPGGTPLGERIREMLLNAPMDLRTETLLAFAARQEHIAQVIGPALESGKWVLSDRFTDATYAYQGGGRGLGEEKIARLEAWVQEGLQPDLSLYFDVPAAVGIARRQAASESLDRFERERGDFFERVRDTYLVRAQREPRRLRIIDSTRTLAQVRAQLQDILAEVLR